MVPPGAGEIRPTQLATGSGGIEASAVTESWVHTLTPIEARKQVCKRDAETFLPHKSSRGKTHTSTQKAPRSKDLGLDSQPDVGHMGFTGTQNSPFSDGESGCALRASAFRMHEVALRPLDLRLPFPGYQARQLDQEYEAFLVGVGGDGRLF